MQGSKASPLSPVVADATSDDPLLAALVQRAKKLDTLDRTLREAMPHELAKRCRLANVRGSCLVFLASSSPVAARLRVEQPELLRAAGLATGQRYDKLTVKVAPVSPVPPEAAPYEPLSTTASEHLSKAARVLADPELRDLFLKLASFAD